MQHHEWMEEIFNSPYSAGQIVPVELGLGRKGELEALTSDFFNASTATTPSKPLPLGENPPRVGRLEPGKAANFAKKAAEKVAEINAEMEQMKQQHAKRMAKLNKGAAVKAAEKSLRSAPMNDMGSGTDDWIFDGLGRSPTSGDGARPGKGKSVDSISTDVEALLGKEIKLIQELECTQKGGIEEKIGSAENDGQDYDLISPLGAADGQNDLSTLYTASQDLLADQDQVGSMHHSPQASRDIMTEMPDASESKDVDSGDWVIVNKQHSSEASPHDELPHLENEADVPTVPIDSKGPGKIPGGAGDISFTPDVPESTAEDFTTNDFSESMDFGNLDTAGEALSGYDAENANMGLDEHGDLGLDDSAFGDAFHAAQASPGQPNQTGGP